MTNRAQGRKKSLFPGNTGIPSGATLDFVSGGVNYKIPIEDFLAALNVTGSIVQDGADTGTPVLDTQADVHKIRNLETDDKSGISALISAVNGIRLALDAQVPDGSGIAVLDTNNKIRHIKAGSGMAATAVNGDIVISVSATPGTTGVVVVNTLADFPSPIGGVIPLAAETVYFINDLVDVGVNTFSLAELTVVTGINQLANGIISSGSGTLFSNTGGFNNAVTDLSITAPNATIFGLSFPTAQAALLIEDLNVISCVSLCNVNNFFRFRVESVNVTLATSDVFVFTGQCDFFNLSTVLVQNFTGSVFSLDSAVFKRFSADTMQVLSLAGANKIIEGLASSGNIVTGGFGQIQQVTVFGSFTDSTTILPTDILWNFANNSFASNSVNRVYAQLLNNATATVLVATVPTLAAGTWSTVEVSRFTADVAGRMTYIGVPPIHTRLSVTFTLIKAGSGTDDFEVELYLNGSPTNIRAEFSTTTLLDVAGAFTGELDIVQGDYLELYITNQSATLNATLSNVNFLTAGD